MWKENTDSIKIILFNSYINQQLQTKRLVPFKVMKSLVWSVPVKTLTRNLYSLLVNTNNWLLSGHFLPPSWKNRILSWINWRANLRRDKQEDQNRHSWSLTYLTPLLWEKVCLVNKDIRTATSDFVRHVNLKRRSFTERLQHPETYRDLSKRSYRGDYTPPSRNRPVLGLKTIQSGESLEKSRTFVYSI